MAPDITERMKASALHLLYLALLPYTNATSESINADSLKLQLLAARKKVVAGHSGQFTPGGYLSTVIHTTLAGIEPITFRLLVRRATSCATETTKFIVISF